MNSKQLLALLSAAIVYGAILAILMSLPEAVYTKNVIQTPSRPPACEFVYEVGQTLYHDLNSFVERLVVEETVKVVDSEGNESCLYKFNNSSIYFTQEEVLKSNYMVEEE